MNYPNRTRRNRMTPAGAGSPASPSASRTGWLGELSLDHVGLMVVLVSQANYRRRSAVFPTLKALAEACRWQPRTGQHLRDCLRELRELGEIDFDKTQGKKDPYVIAIVADDFFEFQRGKLQTGHPPSPV